MKMNPNVHAISLLLVFGCVPTGGDGRDDCQPGEVRVCECPGADALEQMCREGAFPACVCDDMIDGGATDGSATDGSATDGSADSVDGGEVESPPCADGSIEQRPCGLNARGVEVRACAEGRYGPFGACDDPDACVDDSTEARPCGINGRGEQGRTCTAGAWGLYDACDDPDACIDMARDTRPCGLNGRATETRACADGRWAAWSACDDPDACVDDSTEARPCGANDRGESTRRCVEGQWGDYGDCQDGDVCADGDVVTRGCGLNDRGRQTRACVMGRFDAWSPCDDPDVCRDAADDEQACGLNDRGVERRRCRDGAWTDWVCDDPDMCLDEAVDVGPCRLEGTQERTCIAGEWGPFGECAGGCVPEAAICGRCPDRYEPNETRDEAARLEGLDHPGLILCGIPFNTDYFELVPDVATIYEIHIDRDLRLQAGFDHIGPRQGVGHGQHEDGETSAAMVARAGLPARFSVTSWAGGDGGAEYDLRLTATPMPVCPDGVYRDDCYACADQHEPNDSIRAATPVRIGDRVQGGVCRSTFSDFGDYFRLDLPTAGRLDLTLRTPLWVETRHIDAPPSLNLYDADRRSLPFAGERDITYLALEPQTVYIYFGLSSTAANYSFDIAFNPLDCANGVDDDGDGLIDAFDPGCSGAADIDEADPAVAPACSNGVDDDGDGAIDHPNDRDCAYAGGDSEALSCGLDVPIEVDDLAMASIAIDTTEAFNEIEASCAGDASSPDVPVLIPVDVPSRLVAETTDSSYDTALILRTGCGPNDDELACDDDGGEGVQSRIDIELEPGVYVLVVDGFGGFSRGTTTLEVALTPL